MPIISAPRSPPSGWGSCARSSARARGTGRARHRAPPATRRAAGVAPHGEHDEGEERLRAPPTNAPIGAAAFPPRPVARSQYGRSQKDTRTVKTTAQRPIGLETRAGDEVRREHRHAEEEEEHAGRDREQPIRVPSSSANIAREQDETLPTTTSPAIHGTNGANRDSGASRPRAPRRSAARASRGSRGTARRQRDADPTTSATTTVRVAKTRSAVGSSTPRLRNSASIPPRAARRARGR